MYLLDKFELAAYIKSKHDRNNHLELSRIKLHKSLYFLYGFWISSTKFMKKQYTELEVSEGLLFNASFKAWAYGPVEFDIHEALLKEELPVMDVEEADAWFEKQDVLVKGLIDSYLGRILSTGDFTLVDLSQEDETWKLKFNRSQPMSDQMMDNEEIIYEYMTKNLDYL